VRHKKRRTRFGRRTQYRIATLRSLARSVFLHQAIRTTHTKAKEARRVVDNLIQIAKKDSLEARRRAFRFLGDKTLVSKLFKEIAPLFAARKGGYTRIIPYNFRKGDGASMVLLELTEKKIVEKPKHPKKIQTPEKPTKPAQPKPKAAPALGREVKEEKTVEDVKKTKAKDETKKLAKQKGFLKKMGGFFRRKTNM